MRVETRRPPVPQAGASANRAGANSGAEWRGGTTPQPKKAARIYLTDAQRQIDFPTGENTLSISRAAGIWTMTASDINLARYSDPEVVKHYVGVEGLQRSEAYLFDKYIPSGAAVLDIGVGGGRTTPFLSAKASAYVGVDFSQGMVDACAAKFPALEFHRADACDLGRFEDASFDVVVFSFNGIDYIQSDEARARCMREVNRVLRLDGRFFFSSHNARSLLVWPMLRGATPVQQVWRALLAIGRSAGLAARRWPTRAFREGKGYLVDPTEHGVVTFVSTPEVIAVEAGFAGFRVDEIVNGLYPENPPAIFTPWYYYSLAKAGRPTLPPNVKPPIGWQP